MEHNTVVSGLEFNKLYKDFRFVKLTNKTENHNGFQFKTGLNVDTIPFIGIGSCQPGGIYFIEYSETGKWIEYSDKQGIMAYFRYVSIPDDAKVYKEDEKFKTDKLNLSERHEIFKNEEMIRCVLSCNGGALKYIEDQTEEICKLAVRQNGYALQFVKQQTDEICKLAVQRNGIALEYVKDKTEEICKLAVQENGLTLQHIKEQTEELCKLAVHKNSYALKYVKDQTEELCKLAVQKSGHALKYVKDQTEEICKLAVQQNKNALKYVKDGHTKNSIDSVI